MTRQHPLVAASPLAAAALGVAAALLLHGCGKPETSPAVAPREVAAPSVSVPDPYSLPPSDPYDLPVSDVPIEGLVCVVQFAFDHHNVPDHQAQRLDDLASWLLASRENVTVQGHADSRGPSSYNTLLGLRRAQAVRDYLVREGVPEWRIVDAGSAGESAPVDGHAANRRAEVYIY